MCLDRCGNVPCAWTGNLKCPYPILCPTHPTQDLEVEATKKSNHLERKLEARKPTSQVDPHDHVEDQLLTGCLLGGCACVGRCGSEISMPCDHHVDQSISIVWHSFGNCMLSNWTM